MTGKTHREIGLLFGVGYYLTTIPAEYAPATLGAVIVASYFGSLIPDFDQSTAEFWSSLPYGKVVGSIADPIFKHRSFSHSLFGILLFSLLFYLLLRSFPDYWGINQSIVLICFSISYSSHLLADSFTVEGIPLFWPWKKMFGIPPKPFEGVRIITGAWFENLVIFPIVSISLLIVILSNWEKIKSQLFK
jgi:inner membrane protein